MKPTFPAPQDPRAASLFRAAFNDVHAASLHGFVLMLTVGDRAMADQVAATVMVSGMARAAELRHPERAAAWLRMRAYLAVRRGASLRSLSASSRRSALWQLGVVDWVTDALWQLPLEQRAVLVADVVEGFDLRDAAWIIGRSPERTRAIEREARRRYLDAATMGMGLTAAIPVVDGRVAIQIESAAEFAIGAVRAGSAQ
jgi:hypothetical protein